MTTKELLNTRHIDIIINRLACELIENHGKFDDTVLIGLQPRGVHLLPRLIKRLKANGVEKVENGSLDTTFYRDDFRRRSEPIKPNQTEINVLLENKKVVFVDDVLFTGRSVRSAMDAILSFGRPSEMELLVLIDRRFSRELPIQPDYTGKQVDSLASQKVLVQWEEEQGKDVVYLLKSEDE